MGCVSSSALTIGTMGRDIIDNIGSWEGNDLFRRSHEVDSDEELQHRDLKFHKVVGKQIAIWSYRRPDTLAIYTPLAFDELRRLEEFVASRLEFDPNNDKLMVLNPKRKHPTSVSNIYSVKYGACILAMPKGDQTITLEVRQLNAKYDVSLKIDTTVSELKSILERQKGYPLDRIELLYKDVPLMNDRYLFEYKIANKSRIFTMLNLYYDLFVHVECFWGQTYHMYLDPCMTVRNIVHLVLLRTSSPNLKYSEVLDSLYSPHHLVLVYGKTSMKWKECIGKYGVVAESTIKLLPLGSFKKIGIQKIPVTLDGNVEMFLASEYDCWSVIALRIHGITRIPVNCIRLFKPYAEIDFSEAIGNSWKGGCGPSITASILWDQIDPDTSYGLKLQIELAPGVQEVIRCSALRKIKRVKERLQDIGVPHAAVYDLYQQDMEMPNDEKVVDVVTDPRVPLFLKLKRFPVFIHTPKTVIHKMFVRVHESWATFKVRIQTKTGLSLKNYNIMICGQLLHDNADDKMVFDSKLGIKMSIFLIHREQIRTFLIINNEWLHKIQIPQKPTYQQIKDVLSKDLQKSECCVLSIATFLLWLFQQNDRRKHLLKYKFDPLAASILDSVRLPELYQDQIRELRQEKSNRSVVKIHGLENRHQRPFKPGIITGVDAAIISHR